MEYYAQRQIHYGLDTPAALGEFLAGPAPAGAVIWVGAPDAMTLLPALPAGSQQFLRFGHLRFLLWRRAGAAPRPDR